MHWVETAQRSPFHCAITGRNEGPLIDTGNVLHGYDHSVYVALQGVDLLARFAGWTSPEERAELDQELESLQARVDELEAEVQEADRFAEAAEYTLQKFGQKVIKKPGRKPATTKAA